MTNRKGLLLAALMALLAGAVGQTPTATLSGVVRDASGALVPNVKITARNASTGATRDAMTDSEGRYSLTNLGPGQYEVRAERNGFKTAAQSGVILTVGGATVLDLTIQIGEVSEVVEVKQEEPLIEPTKAELSRVVNERSIESLPIIGRNFVDFAKLSSGVAPGRENTGSVYYFGMNDELNAQPLLTGPNPVLRQNQYGATIGGPLRKDKTFFFGSYEGQRRAESNKFSSVIFNNLAAINVTKRFFGLADETTNVLRANDYDGFLAKLDHKITNNNDFSVRYNLLDSTTVGFLGGGGRASPASTTRRNNKVLDQSMVASDTALLANNVVNEARVQWARRTFDFTPVIKEPDLEVSNLIITGKTTSDMDFYSESRVQLSDNLSVVTGGHALKFGTDFNNLRNTSRLDLFFPARVIFANLGGPGVPGPTFLNQTPVVFWWGLANGTTTRSALPIPFTQAVPSDIASLTTTKVNHNSYGFFGQDEWKATSQLTFTLGLRYDFETYPELLVSRRDKNNFQPRVGLAYSFSPRTVVRAGFGIFNDRQFSSIGQQISVVQLGSAGDLPNANVVFPGVSPVRGLFIQPTVGGPVAATSTTCSPNGPTITTTSAAQLATCIFTTTGRVPAAPMVGGVINPGFRDNKSGLLRTPYSEQGSLEISHELGGGVAITVGYLYVHALKLPAHTGLLNGVQTGTLINGVVVPGVVPGGKPVFNRALGGRVFPELGDFYVTDDIGFSIHHGGTLEVEKRFSRGFSFHGSYTFSKTINNAESVANLADLPEGPSIGTERAVSRQTVPHRFTLAFVSQIPASVDFLGNFKFSSLVTAQSGRRFNIFAGSDANGDGNPLSDRPGDQGRNTLEGPGFASFDLRVAREIRFNERVSAEFSGDFFNLLNRVNVTDLNTVYGATTLSAPPNPVLGFKSPRDASNPFQFQYGLKLRF